MTFSEELKRLGIEQYPGKGILCVDFGVYFPLENQKKLQLDVSLSTEPKNSGKILNLQDLCVLDHRYRSKEWLTLSQKSNGKRCNNGCIIQQSHKRLAEFKWLNIDCRIDKNSDSVVKISVPIAITTSNDNPCTAIKVGLKSMNPKTPELIIEVYEKVSNYAWKPITYATNGNDEPARLKKHKFGDERFVEFTTKTTDKEPEELKYMVLSETVNLFAYKIEDIYVG